mgnify:CR=1 FL=1
MHRQAHEPGRPCGKIPAGQNYKIKLDYGAFPDRPYDSPGTWGDPTKINRILAMDKKEQQ